MIKNTRTKIIRYRLKKYEISIDNLDKNSIIQFKEKIKFLNDSSQKSKKVYKIWNIVVTAVIDAKADYVIALKSNHPLFNDKLNLYFDDKRLNTAYSINSEKVNSSIITYEYFQTEDIKWYADYKSWNKIHSFGLIRKTIIKNGKTSIEKRFYISSLFLDISLFSRAIRNHWNVENKLHWQLDYTFLNDKNTTLNKKRFIQFTTNKKIVLAIINDSKRVYDSSLSSIRNRIAINFEQEILRLFNIISK